MKLSKKLTNKQAIEMGKKIIIFKKFQLVRLISMYHP